MDGIVFSSSYHWYYIHGSRMYITHIKENSRTKYGGGKTSVLYFSKWRKARYRYGP